MSEADVLRDLSQSAVAMGAFADNEDRFRAVVDAFRAKDADSFQRLLGEAQLLERCELVCLWLRSKECVLLCLELCGPPPKDEPPDPREFARLVARVAEDEEGVERLANAIEERDADGFRALIAELKAEPFSHLLCHWACNVYYRRICEIVCAPERSHRFELADELARAGASIGRLAADEGVFAEAIKAAESSNCEDLRAVIDRARLGEWRQYICEWFCALRCIRVCLRLCRAFPFAAIDDPLSEAFAFAGAGRRLAEDSAALERLARAVQAVDAEAFSAILKERGFERFCIQFCHWICFFYCRRFCLCVTPPYLQPWFTEVGNFNIVSDIDAGTGLTNKAKLGHGGPNYGFFSCLELRGFCPTTSPDFPGVPMRYRFRYEQPPGTKVTLTEDLLCRVDAGTRRISWPERLLSGLAGTTNVLTFQDLTIAGAAYATANPDPTPPAAGATWFGPSEHVIVPDIDGWIAVDQGSVSGGFTTLIGFETPSVVVLAGGDGSAAAGVLAGTLVPTGNRKSGVDIGIIFEATRVGGPTSPPDFTNTLGKIHIDNWREANLIDIREFHTGSGTPCSPLSTTLGIEFTADHELMAFWGISLTTAAGPLPGPPAFASGAGTRGAAPAPAPAQPPSPPAPPPPPWLWADTLSFDISAWPTCSYTATLTTIPALTTGLIDRSALINPITFCIGGRAPQRVPLGERPNLNG